MSSGAGEARKRPGFMDSFRAALTPPPMPPDDGKPLVRPTTVTVASVLAILAGAIFVFLGATSVLTLDNQVTVAVSDYNKAVDDCRARFGGIDGSASAPAGASTDDTNAAQSCNSLTPLTEDMISSYRTSNIVFGAIFVVLGVVAAAGGWFLRAGNRWGRLAVIGVVLINVIFSVMLGVANVLILGASLMLIAAVMLCFIGKGGVYFARVKARRAG
jgi:hypothetical protein